LLCCSALLVKLLSCYIFNIQNKINVINDPSVWKLNQTVLELDLWADQIIILSIYVPSTHA
jgi:hypothetical protein